MKKTIILLLLFGMSNIHLYSQDIDFYNKGKNDNYRLPKINREMSFDEFHLLSQNVRMKDMIYAAIVPGKIHFKAQSKKAAYWLVGIRSASYLTMGGIYYYNKDEISKLQLRDLYSDNGDDKEGRSSYKQVFYGAAAVAIGTYLFDLIHGEKVLRTKQEKIRYKYALKLSQETTSSLPNVSNGLALQLRITF